MSDSEKFYIIKLPTGICEIVEDDTLLQNDEDNLLKKWGPYPSKAEAISRRVGLIRAGKCQPQ